LGPTLFVIFINDLPMAAPGHVKIFADDTKLFHKIANTEDRDLMQHQLDSLNEWSQTWQLKFNADKCKVMHLGRSNKAYQYTMKSKTPDNVEERKILDSTEVEKDLGVHVDNQLKFNQHAATAVKKANRILGVIKRAFTNRDGDAMSRLFKTLVRPHLEYANCIWGPTRKGDSDMIESVQRRATRLIPEIQHLPYEERLRHLKLPSMKYRRLRGDMIQTFKIIKGFDRLNPSELFEKPHHASTRGHSEKLHVKYCRTELRKRFFSNRVHPLEATLKNYMSNTVELNSGKDFSATGWSLTGTVCQTMQSTQLL